MNEYEYRDQHHPWCNKQTGPIEECHFCSKKGKDFFGKYPLEEDGDIDVHKYFTDVIERK